MHNNKKAVHIVPDRFKLAKKRSEKKMSNQFLADDIGVSLRQFQNYVNGKRPVPKDMLMCICSKLDCSPDWLTGESVHNIGFTTEDMKTIAALMPAYALKMALGDYIVENKRQSPFIPENNYVQISGKKLTFQEYDYLLDELNRVIDFSVDRLVNTIILCRDNFKK